MLDLQPFNCRSLTGLPYYSVQLSYYIQLIKPYFYTF